MLFNLDSHSIEFELDRELDFGTIKKLITLIHHNSVVIVDQETPESELPATYDNVC